MIWKHLKKGSADMDGSSDDNSKFGHKLGHGLGQTDFCDFGLGNGLGLACPPNSDASVE